MRQLWVIGCPLALFVSIFLGLAESRSGHGHGSGSSEAHECRPPGDIVYRQYSPGEVIIFGPCPRYCEDYVWEKRGSTIPPKLHSNNMLQLMITPEVGGPYCCKCRDHPQRECCYGVAVRPKVDFRIMQHGKQTTTIRTKVSVLFECNVTGYPFPVAKIHGPADIFDREHYFNKLNPYITRSDHSMTYRIKVPAKLVRSDFNGTYTCTGKVNIELPLNDTEVNVHSELTKELAMVTYDRPKITSFKCSNRTDDTIVLVCEVECYLPYNITWLYGGENIAVLNGSEKYFTFCNDTKSFLLVRYASNSDTKKSYTCVVDTSYRKGDAMKVFSFSSNNEGIHGHHPVEDKSMFAIFALMVVFIPAIVIVAAVAYMKFKKSRHVQQPRPPKTFNVTTNRRDSDAIKLVSQQAGTVPDTETDGIRRRC